MIAVKTPLFKPGRVVATPAALDALAEAGQSVWLFLARHLAGDWGSVDAHDRAANEEALKDGSRLLSAYTLTTSKPIWIITEVEDEKGMREATTLLLPDDY